MLNLGKWYVDVDGCYKVLRKIIGSDGICYEVYEAYHDCNETYYETTLLSYNPRAATSLDLKLYNVKQD